MSRRYILFLLMLAIVWLTGCGAAQSNPNGDNKTPVDAPVGDGDGDDASDTQPFSELSLLLHRMETLKGEDIKGVTDSIWVHIGNDFEADNTQLAALINAAAKNYVQLDDYDDPVGLLRLYFSESRLPEGGGYEAADFTISSKENIIHVSYHIENSEQALSFRSEISLQDADLYWYLYSLYMENKPIDEKALEKYGEILSERARERMEEHNTNYVKEGFPAFTGFEIAYLRLRDSFDYGEYHYEIYSWDPGFFTDDPDPGRYGWPQDGMLDQLGRIRYYEHERYFVAAWSHDDLEYEFFSNSIFYGWNLNFRADVIKHFTGEVCPILSLPEEQVTQAARIDDAVIEYAVEYVQQMIAYHNELGADGGYSIIEAHITSIEYIPTPAVGLTDGLYLYRLEYRLLADHPENILMTNGMVIANDRITEWDSMGQPYLLFRHDWSEGENIWQPICVTNTEVIMTEYKTQEMMERYGDPYLAAAVELYHKYLKENESNPLPDDGSSSLETHSCFKISDGFLYQSDDSVVAISGGMPVKIPMVAAQVTVNHNGWEFTAEYHWAKYGNMLAAISHSGYYSVEPLPRSDRYLQLILEMGYTYLIDTVTGELHDPLSALDSEIVQRLSFVNFSPDGQYVVVSHHSGTECILLNCTTGEVTQLPYASDIYSISGRFLDETHILLVSAFEESVPNNISYSMTLYDITTGEASELPGRYTAKDRAASNFLACVDDGPIAYTVENKYLVIVDLMTWERTVTQFKVSGVSHIFPCEDALAGVVYEGTVYILDHDGNANTVCRVNQS